MPISLKFLSRRFALSMQRMTFALILITWFMLLIAVPSAFVLSFALGLSFASIKEVSRCYYQQCLSISHKQHGVRSATISELYRERWNVELFFKWIKQHLRIKFFYGTSENAIYLQIWIAVCTYLLLALTKKEDAHESIFTHNFKERWVVPYG